MRRPAAGRGGPRVADVGAGRGQPVPVYGARGPPVVRADRRAQGRAAVPARRTGRQRRGPVRARKTRRSAENVQAVRTGPERRRAGV